MEHKLTTEIPELKEVTMEVGKSFCNYKSYLDAMFINFQCDAGEMPGASRNNRLLFVNMTKYHKGGRQMIAEAFPHCAVVNGGDMVTKNMSFPVSEEERNILKILCTHFYLVIPFSTKAMYTKSYQCVGGNYSETYSARAANGSLHTTDISRCVVDIFAGGKAIDAPKNRYGSDLSIKRNYLNNVVHGVMRENSGVYFGIAPGEDVSRPIKEAHFDEVLEGLFL